MSDNELNAELAAAGLDPKEAAEPLRALRGARDANSRGAVSKDRRRLAAASAALAAAAAVARLCVASKR
ncbi:MAG TPA: hypothetical protein VGY54_26480 [Polyangiaceae bacterium]|jgi:hypothetical protein|nr:hypothetical protein [Polyangiaceae bacterium]